MEMTTTRRREHLQRLIDMRDAAWLNVRGGAPNTQEKIMHYEALVYAVQLAEAEIAGTHESWSPLPEMTKTHV